jgi:hypothetical protein
MVQRSREFSSVRGACVRWRFPVARLAAVFAVLFAVLMDSRTGSANSAALGVYYTGHEAGAFLTRRTSLIVAREELNFVCDASHCEFLATYHVQNATDADESVIGAFYGIDADRLAATADGGDVKRPLSDAETQAIDAVANLHPRMYPLDQLVRQGFALRVAARSQATLVFSGFMYPVLLGDAAVTRAPVLQPIEARHPWLGGHARKDVVPEYAYILSPILSWGGSPEIDVTVHCSRPRIWASGQMGWTVRDDEQGFVARKIVAARDAGVLRFRIVSKLGTTVRHGGPTVGVGTRLGAGGLRGRVGYEVAFPWWMIESVSAETDIRDATTIVPLVEVASPYYGALFPSFAVGAGVPVQLRSNSGAVVGVRGQLTVSFPVLSLVAPFDVFPTLSGDAFQASLFAQVSF